MFLKMLHNILINFDLFFIDSLTRIPVPMDVQAYHDDYQHLEYSHKIN